MNMFVLFTDMKCVIMFRCAREDLKYCAILQSQKVVTVNFSGEELLSLGFAEESYVLSLLHKARHFTIKQNLFTRFLI